MGLPARAPGAPPASATGRPTAVGAAPGPRKLKKGDLLFAEGENSRAMYLLKSGMVRLFKKKSDGEIELDTVHSGQILGELAFLDGNPRSASGEALCDCEVVEISGPQFQQTLQAAPEWMKILLKTVVSRLRAASTRIRQLEQASSAFDYDKDGKRSASYVYMPPLEVMRILSGILLVSSRYGQAAGESGAIEIRVGLLQRYVNQIMSVPVAKMTSLLDALVASALVTTVDEGGLTKFYVKDLAFLDSLISYMNEENLMEPSKRHDLTPRGFFIMSLMMKHLSKSPRDEASGMSTVNLAAILKAETAALGKEPFRTEEFDELNRVGYATQMNVISSDEIVTLVKTDDFTRAHRIQRFLMCVRAVNEQKRRGK